MLDILKKVLSEPKEKTYRWSNGFDVDGEHRKSDDQMFHSFLGEQFKMNMIKL